MVNFLLFIHLRRTCYAILTRTEGLKGWKSYVFWYAKVRAHKSKFRRRLYTSKFCAPCDVRRYTCFPQHVACRAPNEIDYGKINVELNSRTAVSTRTTSLTWRH